MMPHLRLTHRPGTVIAAVLLAAGLSGLLSAHTERAAARGTAAPAADPIPGRLILPLNLGGPNSGLAMMNPDGTHRVSLMDNGRWSFRFVTVSAATGMIAFSSGDLGDAIPGPINGQRIFVVNADGTGLRQVTFYPGQGGPGETEDYKPVISPDGTRIAFLSRRSAGLPLHTCSTFTGSVQLLTQPEVFVVNVDGTGLSQVTQPVYYDDGYLKCAANETYAVAWGPGGQQLALVGFKKYEFKNQDPPPGLTGTFPAVSVVGVGGGTEQVLAIDPKGNDPDNKDPIGKAPIGGTFIEWAPGSRILFDVNLGAENEISLGYVSPGGGVSVTPAQDLVGQVGFGGATDNKPHGGSIAALWGGVRYSLDGSHLLFSGTSPRANNDRAYSLFIDTGSAPVPNTSSYFNSGSAAWAPGPPIPPPARLVLAPSPLTVYAARPEPIAASLLDAQGSVIVRAALLVSPAEFCPNCGYHCDVTDPTLAPCSGNRPSINLLGVVTANVLNPGTGNICGMNAGLRTCIPYQSSPSSSIIGVTATQPTARTSGTGGAGVFTVQRAGRAPLADLVPFVIGVAGTAQRDVDYALDMTGNTVTIAGGQVSVAIKVTPLRNQGNKTVILTLQASAENYVIDFTKPAATVTITDDGPPPTVLTLSSITPGAGGDAGQVTAALQGSNFAPTATVKLTRAGQPDIVATNIQVAVGGLSLTTTLDLSGKARGKWSVVLTNPGGLSVTLPDGFTIEETRRPDVWADVVGRSFIRGGRPATFHLVYGNRGNIDAVGAIIYVTGSRNLTLTPGPEFPKALVLDGVRGEIPRTVNTSDRVLMPFWATTLAAGATRTVSFQLTSPGGDFDLGAAVLSDPRFRNLSPEIAPAPANSPRESGSRAAWPRHGPAADYEDGFLDDSFALSEAHDILLGGLPFDNFVSRGVVQNSISKVFGNGASISCEQAAKSRAQAMFGSASRPGSHLARWTIQTIFKSSDLRNQGGIGHITTLLTSPDGQRHYLVDNYVLPTIIPMEQLGEGRDARWIPKLQNVAHVAALPYFMLDSLMQLFATRPEYSLYFEDVIPTYCFVPDESRRRRGAGSAIDPNDKVGLQGAGTQHVISSVSALPYTVFFENKPEATLPAQDVVITDQLDITKFDLSTFQLGTVGFGSRSVTPPPGLRNWITDVDMRPQTNLVVRITAGLDLPTGVARWTFISLDPVTLQPTDNPLIGFLPPNTAANAPAGEGSVLFSIMPKPELQTGAEIRNGASIVFDANAPLLTPIWLNTIDKAAPTSSVGSLAATQSTTSFPLQWSGSDAGAGIAAYSVYVSENDGPFTLWLFNTTATTATFAGDLNKNYAFYSVARDGAGNVQVTPTAGQASTRISFTAPTNDLDGDTLGDTWERQFGVDPTTAIGLNGAAGDPDGDGQSNAQELASGTHPRGFFVQYLAEGATGTFFNTRIALANADAVKPGLVLLRFLRADGTSGSHWVTVPPLARRTIDVATVAGMTTAEFSTVVESDHAIVTDRTMTWDRNGYGSHAETAISTPARTWYLAEGATHSGFDLFYLLQNPTATAAAVEVTYLLPAPASPIVKNYTVAPNSRFNIWVDQQAAGLASTDVSAVVSSPDVPIIVERAMYLNAGGLPFGAGHNSAGITTPATRWFLAEGATGKYFDLFVLIANPNAADAAVEARYLLPDGSVVTRTYTVAARSRFNIWVDFEEARLADTAVSTTLTSTNNVPIIVERAMWWPNGPATWQEAHNSPGSVATGTRWGLAEGEIGGPTSTETYILIANTSATAGFAKVTLLFEDGTTAERTFPLNPNSRFNIAVASDFPAAAGKRFGAVVESVGATLADIVVERAMYSNANGVVWAAGTNALGTRLR